MQQQKYVRSALANFENLASNFNHCCYNGYLFNFWYSLQWLSWHIWWTVGLYADLDFKEGELVLKDQILVGAQHCSNKVLYIWFAFTNFV